MLTTLINESRMDFDLPIFCLLIGIPYIFIETILHHKKHGLTSLINNATTILNDFLLQGLNILLYSHNMIVIVFHVRVYETLLRNGKGLSIENVLPNFMNTCLFLLFLMNCAIGSGRLRFKVIFIELLLLNETLLKPFY